MIALNSAPDDPHARQAARNLDDALDYLKKADAQAAADAISQADQALVWLIPDSTLQARTLQLLDELRSRGLTASAQRLDRMCGQNIAKEEDGKGWSDPYWRQVAAAVAGAIGDLAEYQHEEWINEDLQVARLRLLAAYVGGALVLTLAATMIVANPHPVRGWPVSLLASMPAPVASLLASTGVAVLGAAGGLFSGLLVTQGATTSLLRYRTSVLRLILKPLVGALMACIIYIALSWQVVPGITVTNGGTFLVLGFITGFSERYILRVLNVPGAADGADSAEGKQGRPGKAEIDNYDSPAPGSPRPKT